MDLKSIYTRLWKTPLNILLAVLILFFLLFFQFGNDFTRYPNFDGLDLFCFDHVNDRSVYKQETPCYQGPLFYLAGFMLKEIFIDNFNSFIIILAVLLYAFSFLFAYKIVKNEVGDGHTNYIITLFLFLVFVFIYGIAFVGSIDEFNFADLFAFFFFIAGFYSLFYSQWRFQDILGSILLTFAFLSKQTYIFPLGAAFVFYSIKILEPIRKGYNFDFKIKDIYKIIPCLLIIAIIIVFFNLFFPNFLNRTFNLARPFPGNENINPSFFSDGLSGFTPTFISVLSSQSGIFLFFLFIIFLFSSYMLTKRKDFISRYVFSLMVIITPYYLFLGNNVSAMEYKRILFVMPLFIVIILKLVKSAGKNLVGKFLLILILLFLIYPAFKIIFLDHQVSQLERDVGSVLQYIPEQEYILTEKDRFGVYDVDYKIDIVKTMPFGVYGPFGIPQEGLGVNLSEWLYNEQKKADLFYRPIIKNIIDKRYSAIMYKAVGGEGIIINKIIASIRDLSNKNNVPFDQLFPMQCYIYTTTIEDRCSNCYYLLTLYFSNPSHCDFMKEKIISYYNEHFEGICKMDRRSADFVKSTLIQNGINFNKVCESGGNLLEDYSNRREIQVKDLFIILLIFIVIVSFYLYKGERRKLFYEQLKEGYRENKKLLFIVFIVILLFGFLFFYDSISSKCKRPYITQNDGCCLDENDDGICDGKKEEDHVLKECLISKSPNEKIVLGKSCSSEDDCILYGKQIGIPGVLTSNNVECVNTYYMDLPDLIPCNTKQDCLNSIENKTDFSSVIRCGELGFCQMTEYSSKGLKNLYSYKRNE